MKVCTFGSYDKDYSRNRILIKSLKNNNIEVVENKVNCGFIKRQFLLLKNFISNEKDFDFLLLFHTGRQDVILAFLIAKLFGKKIVFDIFFSGYNTMVETRAIVKPSSIKAKMYWYVDRICCLLSDAVLLDTNAHINYFLKAFGLSACKFKRIFIGSDEDIFKPSQKEFEGVYTIWWHGTYIPGHGADIIIKAAKLLEDHSDIKFILSGQGQCFKDIKDLTSSLELSNVEFIPLGSYEDLASSMSVADICLGVFDASVEKYSWVIPNKCFEAAAVGKPLITGESVGMKEAFTHEQDAYFCKMSDPEDLANSILRLVNDPPLRLSIAQKAHALFMEKFTTKEIGKEFKLALEDLTQITS